MSLESCEESKVEAKGLLEHLGCLVLVEKSDTGEVLKCQFEDRKQHPAIDKTESHAEMNHFFVIEHHVMLDSGGSLRPVKFKVEFIRQPGGSSPEMPMIAGTTHFAQRSPLVYQSCMSLTVEKGSAPLFKSICNALRKVWE